MPPPASFGAATPAACLIVSALLVLVKSLSPDFRSTVCVKDDLILGQIGQANFKQDTFGIKTHSDILRVSCTIVMNFEPFRHTSNQNLLAGAHSRDISARFLLVQQLYNSFQVIASMIRGHSLQAR